MRGGRRREREVGTEIIVVCAPPSTVAPAPSLAYLTCAHGRGMHRVDSVARRLRVGEKGEGQGKGRKSDPHA